MFVFPRALGSMVAHVIQWSAVLNTVQPCSAQVLPRQNTAQLCTYVISTSDSKKSAWRMIDKKMPDYNQLIIFSIC